MSDTRHTNRLTKPHLMTLDLAGMWHYQNFMRTPVLKTLLSWLMGWSNQWILKEDIRIVECHDTPVSPGLDGSELLLPCDIAVIAYRRLRQGWQ